MSTSPDNDLNLDQLFLPAWAQGSPDTNPYAKYEGRDEPSRGDRRGGRRDWGDRPKRRPDNRGRDSGGPRGNREGGQRPGGRQGKGGPRPQDRRQREHERPEPPPLPEINVTFAPEEKGVESLARQIRMNGRAYPLFDIARMILQKSERHLITFNLVKRPDGSTAQPLFLCVLDNSLWLSEDEAVAHVLSRHFGTFYQTERTATEPPKGTYTFVAQCGMSGVILGPPNYHDYQTKLHRLHNERFSRLPFEVFKSRVKIVRDEAVVKQWIDDQSWKTEYIALNVPETLRFANRAEVEAHFRSTHLPEIIKPVESSHTLGGQEARNLRGPLARLVMKAQDDQRRFPLQIATVLSQQFASHGLQFFKVNKTVTHVSVARPHFLDLEATPVSENIRKIVAFIDATKHCTRRKLIEGILPPELRPVPATMPTPAKATQQDPTEQTPASETEGQSESATGSAPPSEPAPAPVPPKEPEQSPEFTALITDLHWLVHQGHVIEFATGILETAKKPVLKKKPTEPKPEAESKKKPAESATTETDSQSVEPWPAEAQPETTLKEAATPFVTEESTSSEHDPTTEPHTGTATETPAEPLTKSVGSGDTVATPAPEPEPAKETETAKGPPTAEPDKRDS